MVCIDVRHLYQSHRQLSNGASDLLTFSYDRIAGDEKSHDILIAACGKVQQHRVHPELLF